MNKFLIRFLGFAIGSIIVFPIVTVLLESSKPEGVFLKVSDVRGGSGFTLTRLREADTTRNVDILMLGSSLAYLGIDPRAFDSLGFRSFNLGTNLQTPLETEYLVNKFIDNLNPKFVIWDMFPITLMDSGYESFIDLYSNNEIDIEMINLMGKRFDAISQLIVLGVKRKILVEKELNEPLIKSGAKYIKGGFVENELKRAGNFPDLADIYFVPKQNQIEAVNRILQVLTKKNIKIVIVAAPIHPDRFKSFKGLNTYNNLLKNWKDKNKLIGAWDFNYLRLGSENFYDKYHLNNEGVILYNRELIKRLKPVFDNYNLAKGDSSIYN